MKRGMNTQFLTRRLSVLTASVCDKVRNAAQELFALRFYFFVNFFFTGFPI